MLLDLFFFIVFSIFMFKFKKFYTSIDSKSIMIFDEKMNDFYEKKYSIVPFKKIEDFSNGSISDFLNFIAKKEKYVILLCLFIFIIGQIIFKFCHKNTFDSKINTIVSIKGIDVETKSGIQNIDCEIRSNVEENKIVNSDIKEIELNDSQKIQNNAANSNNRIEINENDIESVIDYKNIYTIYKIKETSNFQYRHIIKPIMKIEKNEKMNQFITEMLETYKNGLYVPLGWKFKRDNINI